MRPVRLAVIGGGHIGSIHARLASELADAQLVGVADPDASARAAIDERLSVPTLADFRELIGHIDAAIVAVPTRLHRQVGIQLARAGIHLLVEKPLAITVADADLLLDAADRAGVLVQVGHVERFNPAFAQLLPHAEDPKYIEAVRLSGFPFRSTDIGVVLDLMIHDLDIALAMVRSPVRSVEALGFAIMGRHEDAAQARVTFESGCVANFTASRVSFTSKRQMQVWTAKAFAGVDYAERTTTLVQATDAIVQRQLDVDALSPQEKEHLKSHLFDELFQVQSARADAGNAIADQQREFVESIRSGQTPRVPGQAGRDAVALAEKIVQSIGRHRWDGASDGRVGPLAAPAASILGGPHWARHTEAPEVHREAG